MLMLEAFSSLLGRSLHTTGEDAKPVVCSWLALAVWHILYVRVHGNEAVTVRSACGHLSHRLIIDHSSIIAEILSMEHHGTTSWMMGCQIGSIWNNGVTWIGQHMISIQTGLWNYWTGFMYRLYRLYWYAVMNWECRWRLINISAHSHTLSQVPSSIENLQQLCSHTLPSEASHRMIPSVKHHSQSWNSSKCSFIHQLCLDPSHPYNALLINIPFYSVYHAAAHVKLLQLSRLTNRYSLLQATAQSIISLVLMVHSYLKLTTFDYPK